MGYTGELPSMGLRRADGSLSRLGKIPQGLTASDGAQPGRISSSGTCFGGHGQIESHKASIESFCEGLPEGPIEMAGVGF